MKKTKKDTRTLYYVEFDCGCSLVRAPDVDSAEMFLEREFGRRNGPYHGKKATEDDEAYVRAMGGKVHETGAISCE